MIRGARVTSRPGAIEEDRYGSPMRKWYAWVVVLVLGTAAWLLYELAFWGVSTSHYYCALCRSTRVERHLSFVALPDLLTEDDYAEWYQRNVEPHHEHVWVCNGSRHRGRIADCFAARYPPLLLHRGTIQAICHSMSPQQRVQFIHDVSDRSCRWDGQRQMMQPLQRLNRACEANPKRKNWPKLLKKVGLWPG